MNDVAAFLTVGKDFDRGDTFQSIMTLESSSGFIDVDVSLRLSIL